MNSRGRREAAGYRILIATGGTGGHVYPALAVANYLLGRHAAELFFVGAGRMEVELVQRAGHRMVSLPVRGYKRGVFWSNVLFPFRLLVSVCLAACILFRIRPHVLFGTGGYASFPVLWLGALLGYPVLLLEPNAFAGWANRILARRAKGVCVSYQGMERFFPSTSLYRTGTPLRASLFALPRPEEGRKAYGLLAEKETLLVLGGSLGAGRLNRCLVAGWRHLHAAGYQLIWQSGVAHEALLRQRCGPLPAGVHLVGFLHHMETAYAAASVVVARAGALTVAELVAVGRPAVLVPAPNLAADHQRYNAEAMAQAGMARCVLDHEAEEKLLAEIMKLLEDKKAQASIRNQLARAAKEQMPPATEVVGKQLLALAHPRTKRQSEDVSET